MAILFDLTNSEGVTQNLNEVRASAVFDLGDIYHDNGNTYQYAYASEDLTQGATLTLTACTGVDLVATGSVGATRYKGRKYAGMERITQAAAFTAGAHEGWIGFVDDGTGEGQGFEVVNNDTGTLYLEDAIITALTVAGTSDISLYNPHSMREIDASTDEAVCGIAQVAVDFSVTPYFWMQTSGVAPVLNGATNATAGLCMVTGDNTAGTTAASVATTYFDTAAIVGTCITACGADDVPIWLKLRI